MKSKIYSLLLLLFSFTAAMSHNQKVTNLLRFENPGALTVPENIITGKVTDETGNPLSDVTVLIKGGKHGVTTNNTGVFSINANKNDVLVFSYVGFQKVEIPVGDQSTINVVLKQEKNDLNEIVVVGYGTVRKKDLTGAVISIKGDEVRKVPAGNVMESLQGKLAGVDVVRTSGAAGANTAVAIRGNRSINANNSPLYIVDGIQYDKYEDINLNDVQSMDVLKDAASTAIYGSRGANGVVLITTKRGSSGKAKVTANAYYGVSDVAGYPKPMTGPEFADLKRQAARTTGTWNSTADDAKVFTSASDLAAVQNGTSTYWPGLILQKGSQQDYGVGISGGSDKTKAYFSFDYYKEEGLLNNDYSGRYSLRLNIDQSITNDFKVGVQSQLAYYDQNQRADNILTVANKVIPYFAPYNTDGTLPKYPGNGNQVNPLLEELPGSYINKTNTARLLSIAYAEWKPFVGFSVRSNLGVVNASSRNGYFAGPNTIERALSTGSLSKITNATTTNITWENIINYRRSFNNHNLDVTLVSSYLSNKQDSSYSSGTGQLLPRQSYQALQNNPANLSIWSNYIGDNLESGTFRVNYNYKSKYLLTFTGRADGASQLAPKNRWSFFPSVAAAWRISDESFMQKQDLFNDLKLRVSYGVTGNAAVRPYQTQAGLILIPFSWNDAKALAYGLSPNIGNPELGWELTNTANVGLDFSLLKNRITASVDYYDSKTHDLLLERGLPGSTGGNSVLQNIGKTRNTGIEISLNTVNIDSRNFRWSSGFTFTANKERIVDLPNGINDILNKWFIGSPVNSFYDYEKVGIWQTSDSVAARSYGYKPGDIRVKDQDASKTITAIGDRVILGSAVPKFILGFNNDIKFKDFDFNLYIFARVGQMFVSDYANKFEPNAIENGAVVDYWTPENPTNSYPRPNINVSRAALPFATTLGYEDGSFVKVRNITLGYSFPKTFAGRMHLGNVRLYVSAKNYITFSKVKDYDPEGSGSFDRPLTKLIVTGINIEL